MFEIRNIESVKIKLIELIESDKCKVQIAPSCGAVLFYFASFKHKSENIFDCDFSLTDFASQVTSSGFKSCKLSPFACRIKNAEYSFNGEKYKLDKFLLGKNAIHGLIYDKSFEVVSTSADEKSAEAILKYEYRGEENGYPFSFDCMISYRLEQKNKLIISTTIANKDDVAIPVQDGWHPYFTLGKKIDELELTVKTRKQVVFDAELIPTGQLKDYNAFVLGKKLGAAQLDDCFLLDQAASQPLCILKDVENGIQVAIEPDNTYPYLQLYTPPHRNSIAIENLSAPPDAFNNGINLIILEPGQSKTFTTSFTITDLK